MTIKDPKVTCGEYLWALGGDLMLLAAAINAGPHLRLLAFGHLAVHLYLFFSAISKAPKVSARARLYLDHITHLFLLIILAPCILAHDSLRNGPTAGVSTLTFWAVTSGLGMWKLVMPRYPLHLFIAERIIVSAAGPLVHVALNVVLKGGLAGILPTILATTLASLWHLFGLTFIACLALPRGLIRTSRETGLLGPAAMVDATDLVMSIVGPLATLSAPVTAQLPSISASTGFAIICPTLLYSAAALHLRIASFSTVVLVHVGFSAAAFALKDLAEILKQQFLDGLLSDVCYMSDKISAALDELRHVMDETVEVHGDPARVAESAGPIIKSLVGNLASSHVTLLGEDGRPVFYRITGPHPEEVHSAKTMPLSAQYAMRNQAIQDSTLKSAGMAHYPDWKTQAEKRGVVRTVVAALVFKDRSVGALHLHLTKRSTYLDFAAIQEVAAALSAALVLARSKEDSKTKSDLLYDLLPEHVVRRLAQEMQAAPVATQAAPQAGEGWPIEPPSAGGHGGHGGSRLRPIVRVASQAAGSTRSPGSRSSIDLPAIRTGAAGAAPRGTSRAGLAFFRESSAAAAGIDLLVPENSQDLNNNGNGNGHCSDSGAGASTDPDAQPRSARSRGSMDANVCGAPRAFAPALHQSKVESINVMNLMEINKGASILFADIVGYTKLSTQIRPDETMSLLHIIYSKWDDITRHFPNILKLDVIGDSYMVASNLHPRLGTGAGARELISFASELLNSMDELQFHDLPPIKVRIGICTGDVASGCLGKYRLKFTTMGDAVNSAARMEKYGRPMCIHMTRSTLDAAGIPPDSPLVQARSLDIKGKGVMDTYLVPAENADAVVSYFDSFSIPASPSVVAEMEEEAMRRRLSTSGGSAANLPGTWGGGNLSSKSGFRFSSDAGGAGGAGDRSSERPQASRGLGLATKDQDSFGRAGARLESVTLTASGRG